MATEILLAAGLALLVFAALHDAAFRTVPNTVCAGLALCGLLMRGLDGDLPSALAAALLVFACAFICWRLRWMGGGDVKLLGAVALLVPPVHVPMMLISICLAGGALTIPYIIARRRLRAPTGAKPATVIARVLRTERRRLRQGGPLPYAVAIAAGVCFAIVEGAPL